jgi:hypothetical protein
MNALQRKDMPADVILAKDRSSPRVLSGKARGVAAGCIICAVLVKRLEPADGRSRAIIRPTWANSRDQHRKVILELRRATELFDRTDNRADNLR